MKFNNLSGQKFGKLLVIKRVENRVYSSGRSFIQYECICDCGNKKNIIAQSLVKGVTKSCGCLSAEIYHGHPTHGMTNTRLFTIWRSIIQRCENENHVGYKSYGGIGIKICEEWRYNFKTFYDWAVENGYSEGLSIDRIDNQFGYYPDNCRWATKSEQQRNRRDSICVDYKGEKININDLSKILKINIDTLLSRYYKGLTGDKLFAETDFRKSRLKNRN